MIDDLQTGYIVVPHGVGLCAELNTRDRSRVVGNPFTTARELKDLARCQCDHWQLIGPAACSRGRVRSSGETYPKRNWTVLTGSVLTRLPMLLGI